MKTQRVQPGLGPAHLEELHLFKDSIGLKNKVVLLDFPSPKDPMVRYKGVDLSQTQISQAKEECRKNLVKVNFKDHYYANLASLDSESGCVGPEGQREIKGKGTENYKEKEMEEEYVGTSEKNLDKSSGEVPCAEGTMPLDDDEPQERRDCYGNRGHVKPQPLPFVNLRLQEEFPGFIMDTGKNHVYVGQGSGYGPFDKLGPGIEQSELVLKDMEQRPVKEVEGRMKATNYPSEPDRICSMQLSDQGVQECREQCKLVFNELVKDKQKTGGLDRQDNMVKLKEESKYVVEFLDDEQEEQSTKRHRMKEEDEISLAHEVSQALVIKRPRDMTTENQSNTRGLRRPGNLKKQNRVV